MNYAHLAVGLIVATIVLGVGWDVVVVFIMGKGQSICEACRELNQATDGLFALTSLALWVHIFFKCFLPSCWISY